MLQDLELSLNGIVDIQIEFGDFKLLQRLDLSYNAVSGLSLLTLGMLPSLKELHLTGVCVCVCVCLVCYMCSVCTYMYMHACVCVRQLCVDTFVRENEQALCYMQHLFRQQSSSTTSRNVKTIFQ